MGWASRGNPHSTQLFSVPHTSPVLQLSSDITQLWSACSFCNLNGWVPWPCPKLSSPCLCLPQQRLRASGQHFGTPAEPARGSSPQRSSVVLLGQAKPVSRWPGHPAQPSKQVPLPVPHSANFLSHVWKPPGLSQRALQGPLPTVLPVGSQIPRTPLSHLNPTHNARLAFHSGASVRDEPVWKEGRQADQKPHLYSGQKTSSAEWLNVYKGPFKKSAEKNRKSVHIGTKKKLKSIHNVCHSMHFASTLSYFLNAWIWKNCHKTNLSSNPTFLSTETLGSSGAISKAQHPALGSRFSHTTPLPCSTPG